MLTLLQQRSSLGTLLLTHRIEDSILDQPMAAKWVPYEVAGRKRLATCSGVSWFSGHHLAVVNLYGGHLRIYRLVDSGLADGKVAHLRMLHQLSEGISNPEDVTVSSDGRLIAVTHSLATHKGLTLHHMNPVTMEPGPAFERLRSENTCHGSQFSPDARHLAFTTIDGPGTVEVFNITVSPAVSVCIIQNRNPALRPKAVCFTSDGKYVAILYSPLANTSAVTTDTPERKVAIHRYHSETGTIEEACESSLDGHQSLLNHLEIAAFAPNTDPAAYHLYAANQAKDMVVEIVFDSERRRLQTTGRVVDGLSFPHGIDISRDGQFLAVTNYGDDCLRIYRLTPAVDDPAITAKT